MARSRRMSAHKRLRARRKAERAELKRVTSPADVADTSADERIAASPLREAR
jgi:hypothetical protein